MQIKTELHGVEETLLIPLWARAAETRRPDGIVRDERAVNLVDQISYDFSRFEGDWKTQIGVAVRTEILDQAVSGFVAAHPDALVINLAAGLDTRYYRLDNGRMQWVDVDLPNSMALRRTFLTEDARHRFITGSVLDDDWAEALAPAPSQRVLIVIEGLLFYFDEADVRALFARLQRYFPGAEVVFEAFGTLATRNTWAFQSVSRTNAVFKWGLDRGAELEAWQPGLRCLAEHYTLDRHPPRWGYLAAARFVPAFRRLFKIVHVRLGPERG